jgi:membrane dipeptidase
MKKSIEPRDDAKTDANVSERMNEQRERLMDRRGFMSALGAGGATLVVDRVAGTSPTSLATAATAGRSEAATTVAPIAGTVVGCMTLDFRKADAARAALVEARDAGAGVLVVPVITTEHECDAATALLHFRRAALELSDLCTIAGDPAPTVKAGSAKRVTLIPHAHGLQWAGGRFTVVPDMAAAGLRMAKLCSGWRNLAADGCYEASDLTLTKYGHSAVAALENSHLIIDLSCTGRRSSLEAMRLAKQPVVFSHSNAAALRPHPLNLTDEQIAACAATGGVVGVSALPILVADGPAASLKADNVIDHIDHIVKVAGIEHVALGLDFARRIERRYDTDPLPREAGPYPAGLARLADLPAFTRRLSARGYDQRARERILGGNLSRVFERVWRA